MRKLMLDCGSYDLTIVKQWLDSGMIDDETEVITFDPNPEIDAETLSVEGRVRTIEKRREAVWTNSGIVEFCSSNRPSGGYVEGTVSNAPKKRYDVQAIDFSQFVANLPDYYFIICSMDIEGSEFPVLEKMIKDNSIDRIRVLDVEFHHRMLPDRTKDDAMHIIEELWRRGIAVRLKVGLE